MMSAKRAILPFLAISALMLAACASDDNGKTNNGTGGTPGTSGAGGGSAGSQPGTGGGGTEDCTQPKVTTGGEIGNCCDGAEYQSTCIDNNAKALVCQKGKVTQWECANNGCKPKTDEPLHVDCPKPMDECTLPTTQTTDNTYAANDPCPEELAETRGLCRVDRSAGYYCKWDSTKTNRIVGITTCANNDCYLNPTEGDRCGYVECGDPTKCNLPEPQETDEVFHEGDACPAALTGIKGLCHTEKKEGYYCSSGKVVVKSCPKANCSLDPTLGNSCGYVVCGDPTKCELPEPPTTTETFTANEDCPDALKEYGLCKEDLSEGYYCNTQNKVAVKSCPDKNCNLNPTPGASCGYVQCGGN